MKLTFVGHACFLLENIKYKLIFDPYIADNPLAVLKPENICVHYILLTHGHGDHLGDALDIAKRNDATIIAPNELAVYCRNSGCKAHAMHIGGGYNFDFGRVKLTIAHHGSAADLGGQALTYLGNPCGFVVSMDGKNIYHAGDTGLFLDMQLIGEIYDIDVALLPIGDNFTMGIDDAVRAVEYLKPKMVIPMHYNTFLLIKVDPFDFKDKVEKKGFKVNILNPGQQITIE